MAQLPAIGEWGEFSADDFLFSLNNVSTEGSQPSLGQAAYARTSPAPIAR